MSDQISINEILRSAVAAAVAAGFDASAVATAAAAEAERASEDADNRHENCRVAKRAREYAQRAVENVESLRTELEDIQGEHEDRGELLDLLEEADSALGDLSSALRRFQAKMGDE